MKCDKNIPIPPQFGCDGKPVKECNSFLHNVSHRTISEILIEADETSDLKVLSDCWKEVVKNKYKYPLVEIEFAREHLNTLARKMAIEDAEIMKPFFDSLFNGG